MMVGSGRCCVDRLCDVGRTTRCSRRPRHHGFSCFNGPPAAVAAEPGRPADALKPLDEAVDRLEQAGQADEPNGRFVLGWVLNQRGEARAEAGDAPGAGADSGRAVTRFDKLRKDDPDTLSYPREYAAARNGRGAVRAAAGPPRREE